MKEHLAGKGKGSRRSLSSPSVHRVNTPKTTKLKGGKYLDVDPICSTPFLTDVYLCFAIAFWKQTGSVSKFEPGGQQGEQIVPPVFLMTACSSKRLKTFLFVFFVGKESMGKSAGHLPDGSAVQPHAASAHQGTHATVTQPDPAPNPGSRARYIPATPFSS